MSVKYALLSLLYRQAGHGYELRERFEAILGHDWNLNPGQVYTTLDRLENDGLVQHDLVLQDTGPDKKVYSLTPAGEQELRHWFTSPIQKPDRLRDELYVMIAMSLASGVMPPEQVIETQRQGLLRELHEVILRRARCDWAGEVPRLLQLDAVIMHLEADLHWLSLYETRLADLKSYAWPTPPARPRGRPPRTESAYMRPETRPQTGEL